MPHFAQSSFRSKLISLKAHFAQSSFRSKLISLKAHFAQSSFRSKLIRTLQSELYFAKEWKDDYYYQSRKMRGQPHDADFQALQFIPDDLPGCYLDIGANQGQSIEAIKLFKPNARIHSFEPNPIPARKLQTRYAGRDDITIKPCGLADEKQTRTLYVPVYKKFVYDGLASFDRESAASWLNPERLYWFAPDKLELKAFDCITERLDDQCLEPLFIKIDVQGYEYQVIKGGMETIKRCEPILMVEDFFGNDDLVQLLQQLGYEQYVYDRTGFSQGNSQAVINTFLMTPHRAARVCRQTDLAAVS